MKRTPYGSCCTAGRAAWDMRSARISSSLAKKDMRTWMINLAGSGPRVLPGRDQHFDDYVEAVEWAQNFAQQNREVMMQIRGAGGARGDPEAVRDARGGDQLPP